MSAYELNSRHLREVLIFCFNMKKSAPRLIKCSQIPMEELEISFEPLRRIRRKHIFGDGSKDAQLPYEDDLRRTIFSSIDRITAEIRERFQQLQNLAQKYAFLRPEVILSMDELNSDQVSQDNNKEEFQLERVRLQAFVDATNPGCKKELIRSGSLGLLKYIIESKLEDGLLNIVIMLRIFEHLPSVMPVAREAYLS
ncbi:uncharacterized protein TNCV_1744771 [Trichonephila clavipes]|nr:uncharacterized protein TNCV_1744771 [Trichonephila clavipes]